MLKDCVAQVCKICAKRHNTLLHIQRANNTKERIDKIAQINSNAGLSVNHTIKDDFEALLSTATVLIKNGEENWQKCRALLDSGSQSNFITKHLAEKLNLQLFQTNIPVVGIGNSASSISNNQ